MVFKTKMIRAFDLLFSISGLLILSPLLLLLMIAGWAQTSSPLFRQQRIGLHQRPFILIKFRTMPPQTISVATHLVDPSKITSFGRFLRRTKLDELPQLWNVVKGDMSLVGPRPCLSNQKELLQERERLSVFNVRPGITGLAQIKGIDMSTPKILAETDSKMIESYSLPRYFQYIFLTLFTKGKGDCIKY